VERISVTLTNRFAYITDASKESLLALRDYWSYYADGHHFAPAYKLYVREKARAIKEGRENDPIPGWDGKIRLFQKGRVAAGLFRASRKEAEKELGIRFKTTIERPVIKPFFKGLLPATEQYNFQNEAVAKMCSTLEKGGCIITAATGSGKTATTARFLSKLDYFCLFVVHRINLMYQSQKEIAQWVGKEVGVVGNSEFDPRDITVATVQTLKLHQDDPKFQAWFKQVKIVVVDELHKQMAKKNFSLLDKLKPLARYGLTATLQLSRKPVRMKAWAFAGPVGYSFPIEQATKQGVVSQGKVIQLVFPEDYDWSNEKDYQQEYDYEVIDNELKLNSVRKQVDLLLSNGRYVLILVERVRHVGVLHKLFKDTKHRLAYGGIKKSRREQSQDKFEDGSVRLMIANGVFKDGINLKRVDTIIDMTEWPSKDDTLQKFGRGVRKHQDKKSLLFIDYSTSSGRFRKAGVSRLRAWKAAGLPVTKVKVRSVTDALDTLKKELEACGKN
jgi:superfamily II DNA or RNA helicase